MKERTGSAYVADQSSLPLLMLLMCARLSAGLVFILLGASMSANAGIFGDVKGGSEKYRGYAIAQSIDTVIRIALADDIKSGKIKLENSSGDRPEGEIVFHRVIQVLASDGADYLNKSEEAFQNPCKYLDLSDADNRLLRLARKNPNFPTASSFIVEIHTAKTLFGCPIGLPDWRKEYIEKNRSAWKLYLNRLYVSVCVIDINRKTLATRKIKFKGENHE